MKTLGLVLALAFVLAGACVADTATFDVLGQWNQIAAPLVPFNPDPLSVFNGVNIVGTLWRLNPTDQAMVPYDDLDPAMFGNILLGDGYQLWCDAPLGTYVTTITYEGVPDGVPDGSGNMTDMWISLPGNQLDGVDEGGWHLIGQPFDHDTSVVGNLYFTDGTTLKTWEEAVMATPAWCEAVMWALDPVTGGMIDVGFDLASDDHLRKGHGYLFLTKKDNLALIIPAQPS